MTRLSLRQAALFAVTLGVAVTTVRRTLHRNHVRNPAVWRQERCIEYKSDSALSGYNNAYWLTDPFVTSICLFIGPTRSQSARRRELT